MHSPSLHYVRQDSAHFGWDNSIPPVLEVESGEEVELEVRDASGGQLGRDSDLGAVAALDFTRVNPVTGPVFVKGARPGDVLSIEILELRPRDWGWTDVGAIRFLWIGARRAPLWQIVIPLIGIAFLGYTIDKQVTGQSFPYNRFPIVVGAWLILSIVVVVVAPGLARRLGEGLARREGLVDEAAASVPAEQSVEVP